MNEDRRENQRGRPPLREVLVRLDEEVKLLHTHLGGLPRVVEADHVLREIWIDDVHNSTAIEGNTMTRAQVENLVERRQASASLEESLEVEGYARAADCVYRNAPDYTGIPVRVVSEIHKQVVGLAWHVDPPVTRDEPGAWRKGSVRVRSVQVSQRGRPRLLLPEHPASPVTQYGHWTQRAAPLDLPAPLEVR